MKERCKQAGLLRCASRGSAACLCGREAYLSRRRNAARKRGVVLELRAGCLVCWLSAIGASPRVPGHCCPPVIDLALVSTFDCSATNAHLVMMGGSGGGKRFCVGS